MKHIAFTGWGSGGHITPIASLIEYGLQDTEIASQCKLFRFGEQNSLEQKSATQFSAIIFVPISAGKFRRYFSLKSFFHNVRDAWLWVSGIIESCILLKKHRIDIVFCKWWYVALPVCIAAYLWRIPILMHESDTYAGMTNRLVAKMSRTRFVGFPWILAPSRHIWQLLSPRLLDPDINFQQEIPNKTVVLVTWWSQGATTLFEWLLTYLTTHKNNTFHFLILLWSKNSHYSNIFKEHTNVTTFEFINDLRAIARLCQLSDIGITRWWATSLAEQHLFGLRKIIVPVPWTWGNHQRHNGVWYRDTYGDILIAQDDQLVEHLTKALQDLIHYKKPSEKADIKQLFTPLAAVRQELLS